MAKHTQEICLSVYDLFVGLRLKGLRTSILTFFLTNSIFDALLLCFFSLDLMLIFIEICVTFLFPNFKLIFNQYCILFTSVIGFMTLFQGYERVHISYLSIHADR